MPSPTFAQPTSKANANNELVFEVLVPPSPTETATHQPTADLPLLVGESPLPSPTYDSDESTY
ncbi:1798_t:CDS:2 [Racocetra fulgida]|uniref:1798_t:CDS:1 n=1 Tax=Racocetra fulgida TaxID=60492 RepID=A0A9N8VFV3_9GLOM|nr:1798_t:CDS:2 [Racocetra fulgida]